MKKNLLSLSIAALIGGLGVAGAANAGVAVIGGGAAAPAASGTAGRANLTNATALGISPAGIGHILMVPYFTAQNGNATLLSVVNTDTVNGKAVKVRFRGAANSDDLLDFQVFLSPGDVWTANVAKGADGRSVLTTADNSCTQPAIPAAGVAFGTGRLPATFTAEQKAAQTLEGYVEIFNMADVPPTYIDGVQRKYGVLAADAVNGTTANALFTATKHVAGTAPCTDATLSALQAVNAVTNEASAVAFGLNTPTTGLTGGWAVVNVAGASVAWSGNSSALQATIGAGGAAASGRIVFSAQRADAEVAANVNALTNDPLLRVPATGTPKVVAALQDLPDLSTPYLTAAANPAPAAFSQAELVSGAIATRRVINEYLTDSTISAATDWVFSSPTRRYAVAMDYSNKDALGNTVFAPLFTNSATFGTAATAASAFYTAANVTKGTGAEASLLCVQPSLGNFASFDRSEQQPVAGGVVFSPASAAPGVQFCGETSVLSFNAGGVAAASVLGAAIARKDVDATYSAGWATIATDGLAAAAIAGPATAGAAGLPVLGNAFLKATGPVVAGKSTNFSITYGHRR